MNLEDATNEYLANLREINLSFCVEGEPINYVRERSVRYKHSKSGHFYNPKQGLMLETRKTLQKSLKKDMRDELQSLFNNKAAVYEVELELVFFKKIQQAGSKKTKMLKEAGVIRPTNTPDIDNFDKFILDALHNVLYEDDKHVVAIRSEKRYSENPRTEINATIKIIKE